MPVAVTSLKAPSERAALREVVRLFERRLATTGFGRFARVASIGITAGTVASIVAMRAAEGASAPTVKLAVGAVRLSMWLVACAVALAASKQRAIADRRDGIEMLALARGFDGSRLTMARSLAAGAFALRWMLLPAIVGGLGSALSAGSLKVVGARLLVTLSCVVFAAVAAVVLGPLGAVADAFAPNRGRSLLLAVLLLSGLASEIAADPAVSITGALLTVLNGLLYAVGAGRLIG